MYHLCAPRLLSVISLFLLSVLQVAADGNKIPLYRVPRASVSNALAVSSSLSLSSSNEFAYLAHIGIGGEDFLVLLDTGSADLWVISSGCAEEDCQGVPTYKKTSSLSLTDTPFHLDYLMGAVTGTVGSETVTLGQFNISDQVFALANDTSGLGLSGTGNSGILGLSFPAEAAIPDTSGRTLVENVFSSFSNDSNRYFAFKLGRDQNSSSFTIGELDPLFANSTSDFAYTPVFSADGSDYDYWKMPLQSLTINGTTFSLSPSRVDGASAPIAVFDTGTTLMLGPSADVDRFWQSVGGARKTDDGWQVRCDRAALLSFVLGDGDSQKEYMVDPADISWEEGFADGEWCMGGVQGNDGVFSGDWLLGDTFLRNVYVVHHAATNNQPPMIGLKGMTDQETALAQFVQQRGADSTPPGKVHASVDQSHAVGAADICGIATASGFIFGVILMLAICTYTRRQAKY